MPKTQNTSGFSKRELQVLILISLDFTQEEVAELLFISYETVKSHVRNMFNRHEVHSVIRLLLVAVLKGHVQAAPAAPFNINDLTVCRWLN